MTRAEFEYLSTSEARYMIESHLGDDPLEMALAGIPAAVCTQVKLLDRCRTKLPDYYAARCIIPEVSFEQSSSQATGSSRRYSGRQVLDVTCGLGCDAYCLSRNFDRVVTVERDELLADTARYNFGLLGCDNIEVVCADSAEYVRTLTERFDVVYVDPARRDERRRMFLLQDCSPDVTAMAPRLAELADRIVIKASPLFDVEEPERILGAYGRVETETVSVDGECKEVVIELTPDVDGTCPSRYVTVISRGEIERYGFTSDELKAAKNSGCTMASKEDICGGGAVGSALRCPYEYLLLPDAAFVASRTVQAIAARIEGAALTSPAGVILSREPSPWRALRSYKITECMPFKPKVLKKALKERGIAGVTLIKRDFHMSVEEVRKRLGVRDGGDATMVLCGETVYLVGDCGV